MIVYSILAQPLCQRGGIVLHPHPGAVAHRQCLALPITRCVAGMRSVTLHIHVPALAWCKVREAGQALQPVAL